MLGLLVAALAPAFASPTPAAAAPSVANLAFTDLDGDLHPDSIHYSLKGSDHHGYSYLVEFEMSTRRQSPPIAVHASDGWGLQIVARDVDGDHDLDLVVTSGSHGQAVDVWINDGQGGFTSGGVMAFPLSIWMPERSLSSPALLPVRDAALIRSGEGSTVVTPAVTAHPVNSATSLRRSVTAARADSPRFRNTGPRAPPAA